MDIAVLGAGDIGSTIARRWQEAGHAIVLAPAILTASGQTSSIQDRRGRARKSSSALSPMSVCDPSGWAQELKGPTCWTVSPGSGLPWPCGRGEDAIWRSELSSRRAGEGADEVPLCFFLSD